MARARARRWTRWNDGRFWEFASCWQFCCANGLICWWRAERDISLRRRIFHPWRGERRWGIFWRGGVFFGGGFFFLGGGGFFFYEGGRSPPKTGRKLIKK